MDSGQLWAEEPTPPEDHRAERVGVWPRRKGPAFAGNRAGPGFQQHAAAIPGRER